MACRRQEASGHRKEPYDRGEKLSILGFVDMRRIRVRPKRLMVAIAMALSCAVSTACADTSGHDRDGVEAMSPMTIDEALKAHTDQLMSMPGVTGTAEGLCEGQPCVKVFVVEKTPELERAIHGILKGVPLVVEETGRIRARPGSQDR